MNKNANLKEVRKKQNKKLYEWPTLSKIGKWDLRISSCVWEKIN